ncbi:hypothetical protein [Roseovarius sp. M141]|uniref:hypothetical protein n=1 Tax=Roseovarius sp. M141 TaxID=2583806 RepID=UPI0020CD4915|nr:hypothetical protein [Roseovarius sp. M141]
MRPKTLPDQPQTAPSGTVRPCAAETAQRWQDVGGIEGFSLEWMLDRARAPQEAMT